jgi:hypothetical protein
MARTDYIPGADAEFALWLDNLVRVVLERTSGQPPAWTHIPPAALQTLTEKQTAWHEAWALAQSDPTNANKREKTRVRKDTEQYVRRFVNQYLRYEPVTNHDRDLMGVHNPETTHSAVPKPSTVPLLVELTPRRGQQVLVHFRDETEEKSEAVPYGFDGCILNYTCGPAKVTDKSLIKDRLLMTASPFLVETLPPEAQGMWLSCYPQWQNETGKEGPSGDVSHVVVI